MRSPFHASFPSALDTALLLGAGPQPPAGPVCRRQPTGMGPPLPALDALTVPQIGTQQGSLPCACAYLLPQEASSAFRALLITSAEPSAPEC